MRKGQIGRMLRTSLNGRVRFGGAGLGTRLPERGAMHGRDLHQSPVTRAE